MDVRRNSGGAFRLHWRYCTHTENTESTENSNLVVGGICGAGVLLYGGVPGGESSKRNKLDTAIQLFLHCREQLLMGSISDKSTEHCYVYPFRFLA